jgi:hypothetical protein
MDGKKDPGESDILVALIRKKNENIILCDVDIQEMLPWESTNTFKELFL